MYRRPDDLVRPNATRRAGAPGGSDPGVLPSLEIAGAVAGRRQVFSGRGRIFCGLSPALLSRQAVSGLVAVARSGRRMTYEAILGYIGEYVCKDGGERRIRSAAYAVALIGLVCAAQAEQGGFGNITKTLTFHIPAQPLAIALQEYGEKAGVQVLYESNSAVGRISNAVDGDFSPGAALEILLSGSGLKVRYSSPEAITLTNPSTLDDVPPSHPLDSMADLSLGTLRVRGATEEADQGGLRDFSATVQSDIQSALRRNARTRGGNYRLVLDLWVDPSRTIQRTELAQSTGDRERDATVQAALQGLVISRPAPPKTPQPVRVVIVVRALQ